MLHGFGFGLGLNPALDMPPPFRNMLRNPRSEGSPQRPRRTWTLFRRSEPAAPPLNQPELGARPGSPEAVRPAETPKQNESENDPAVQNEEGETADDNVGSPPSERALAASETAGKSTASSVSPSHRGSNRLKSIMAHFRPRRSQQQSDSSETVQPLQPLDNTDPEVTTDPVKRTLRGPLYPLSSNPSTVEEFEEPQRNVSAQTAGSHDSENTSATVYRYPSQRLQAPILELQQFSPTFFTEYPADTRHFAEPSDPFSDKNVEVTTTPVVHAPSKRSSKNLKHSSRTREQGKKASEASYEQYDEITPAPLPTSKHQSVCSPRRGSNASNSSRASRLEPSKAVIGFNMLAEQLDFPVSLPTEDASNLDCK